MTAENLVKLLQMTGAAFAIPAAAAQQEGSHEALGFSGSVVPYRSRSAFASCGEAR